MSSLDIQIIKKYLKEFLSTLTGSGNLSDTTQLIDKDIIDSLNLVQLILFIESKFKIKIDIFDIRFESFESVDTLSNFIIKKIKK